MRVFVAGATGAIGRPLISRLVAAGHDVVGMTRAADRAAAIRAAGAEAAVCDVFDRDRLHAAVADARPEVVVHQLTALPALIDPRKESTYAATNRLRTEGTRLLLDAAEAAGARRVVAQSVAFLYAPTGGWVKSEGDPVMRGVSGPLGGGLSALADLEGQVLAWDEGIVLRYAFFYGPGTSYAADGPYAREVRRRRFPIVGDGAGVFSFIHVDDAASATVAAVERGAGGIYNVADDDPAPMREWLPEYAAAIGARRPFRVPRWIARIAAGSATAAMATSLRGASNAKAKAELGWQPAIPSWRRGFREALRVNGE
jgi:nucleoside-diphosphate-sugar epimerase